MDCQENEGKFHTLPLARGRRDKRREKMVINYTLFIWQGVNETKKIKNPWFKLCTVISDDSIKGLIQNLD